MNHYMQMTNKIEHKDLKKFFLNLKNKYLYFQNIINAKNKLLDKNEADFLVILSKLGKILIIHLKLQKINIIIILIKKYLILKKF